MTNKKILTLISLLLLFSFLMVGCDLFPPPNHAPVITTIALPAATVGTEYTATVVATDDDGDPLTYEVVGPTGMVISETGLISGWTPVEAGTEDITVTITDGITDPVSADFTITVSPAGPGPEVELTGIEVVPNEMNLFETGVKTEDTIDSVTATYSDGSTADIALKDCTYVSSATGVATVSDAGVIKAEAKGSATITVSYKEITKTVYIEETDTLEVTVSAVEVDHIVVLPETMTLYKGGDLSVSKTIESVTAHNNDGTKFEVDFIADCTYGLNPMGIATVEADEVIADEVGETTITITYEGKTDTIEVTVLTYKLDYIVVLPEEMTLYKGGEPKTITSVFAHYNDGTKAEIGLAACEYESSDEDVATVAIGVVTATTPAEGSGEATITVSYEEVVDVTEEAFVTVTVENRPPAINISGAIKDATVGTPYTCKISAIDPDEGDVDFLTYFLDTLPPTNMSIEPTNGDIYWMPLSTDSGETITVEVGVTDGELDDTGSFDIEVVPAPAP